MGAQQRLAGIRQAGIAIGELSWQNQVSEIHQLLPGHALTFRSSGDPGRVDSAGDRTPCEGGDSEGQSNPPMGTNRRDGQKILEGYPAPRRRNGAQRLF